MASRKVLREGKSGQRALQDEVKGRDNLCVSPLREFGAATEFDEELHAVVSRRSKMGVADTNRIRRPQENVGNGRRTHDVQTSEMTKGQVISIVA